MLNLLAEQNIFNQNFNLVGGIDEAGRGPLAGPVVAACIAIYKKESQSVPTDVLNIVNDSKKLTAKKREEAFKFITDNFKYGIGICDHDTIDRINILEATFLAMKKAISALKEKPDFILLDGKFAIPNLSIPQKTIIGGDALIFSIAAASIIAKVTRDRLMVEAHKTYPQYDFDVHKGYGTKIHMEKLKKFGPSPIHRKSFAPVRRLTVHNT